MIKEEDFKKLDKNQQDEVHKIEGLLSDKLRGMVYIQSLGGHIAWILRMVMNKGLNYVRDVMGTIGI